MTENDQQPFSEQGALRELEELQQKIEASRARRKEANEAFDRFLRSFERQPAPPAPRPVAPPLPLPSAPSRPEPSSALPLPPVPVTAAAAPLPAAPAVPSLPPQKPEVQYLVRPGPAPVPAPPAPATIPAKTVAQAPEKIDEPPPVFPSELPPAPPDALDLDDWDRTSTSGVDAFPEESRMATLDAREPFPLERRPVPAALTTIGRSGKRIRPAAAAAAVLVIAAVAFFAFRGNGDDTTQADSAAAETPAAPRAAPQPAPPPVAPPPPRAEISTLRQVWIRVTVDGQKVIEREVPPATRIPLDPASQFVVRAGDAGAVRVAIGGKDQGPVGIDGRVATKAFSVPPKAGQ